MYVLNNFIKLLDPQGFGKLKKLSVFLIGLKRKIHHPTLTPQKTTNQTKTPSKNKEIPTNNQVEKKIPSGNSIMKPLMLHMCQFWAPSARMDLAKRMLKFPDLFNSKGFLIGHNPGKWKLAVISIRSYVWLNTTGLHFCIQTE